MIKVYGTADCSRCIITKIILDNKKIPYQYYDIRNTEEGKQALAEAKKQRIMTMPFLVKDGKYYTDVKDVMEV